MQSGSVMTKEEFKKTEQFAIEEEQRENEWQKNYGEKMPEVIKEMNELFVQILRNQNGSCMINFWIKVSLNITSRQMK